MTTFAVTPSALDLAAAVAGRAAAFRADLSRAAELQREHLFALLAANAHTEFGRAHDFASIRSIEHFRARVPIRSPDELAPWIERAAAGEADVLFAGRAIASEVTGGSTSAGRRVVYSAASLVEFQQAVLPWLDDVFEQTPALREQAAYWSISPVRRRVNAPQEAVSTGPHARLARCSPRGPSAASGGRAPPAGLPDAAYLGDRAGAALLRSLAVPPDVADTDDIDAWQRGTLLHLLRCPSLGFVSIWSPTFLLELLRALDEHGDALIAALAATDPARALAVAAARKREGSFDAVAIWPDLRFVSCWTDAASAAPAARLAARLAQARMQGKGLLATEGAVTVPMSPHPDPVLSPRSGFFEFVDDAGHVSCADELRRGARCDVLLTNASGLYRYRIGDRVECTGHAGQAPMLRFVGRGQRVVDLVGEKLDDAFVASRLDALRDEGLPREAVVMLAPATTPKPHYVTLVDAADGTMLDPARVDALLRESPPYAYARALGQLAAVEVVREPDLLRRWVDVRRRGGQSIGDIKPTALISEADRLALHRPVSGARPLRQAQDGPSEAVDSPLGHEVAPAGPGGPRAKRARESVSTSRFAFALADRSDDAGLRARLAADVMPGSIAITFRREPSYFDGVHLQGEDTTVIKCTERASGTIVGMSCRSLRRVRLGGAPRTVAYLSDLRGDERFRNGTLLARGFRFLEQIHRERPVDYSYAVIYEGNEPARALLTSGRAGMPEFRCVDRLLTPALLLGAAGRAPKLAGVDFRRAVDADRPAIVALLAREWARKTLAPADPDRALREGELRTIAITDFFVAVRGAQVLGCLAAWDQSALRQTHVEGYSGTLARVRPLVNLASRLTPFTSLKPLPPPGARVPYVYLAAIASEGNDAALFDALLRHACHALRNGPWHHAIVGLCRSDPLSQVLRDHRRIDAAGLVHSVRFAGDRAEAFEQVASAPMRYLEAGCL